MSTRTGTLALILAIAVAAGPLTPPASASGAETDEGFAVVELFTSEGCSSCPPGEDALARIKARAEEEEVPVYTVAWHVDYWDYLGWVDPFGSAEATERQRRYGRDLDSILYTPQAIIDGRIIADYAGDAREIEGIARRRLAVSRDVDLQASVLGADDPATFRIEFSLDDRDGYQVEAILLEDGLESRPTAGGNRGRALRHVSTARSRSVPENGESMIRLRVPPAVVRRNASILVLVRPVGQTDIVAVRRLDVPLASGGGITGRLVYPDGSAAVAVVVQLCSDYRCYLVESDRTGLYRIEGVEPGLYRFKTGNAELPGAARIVAAETAMHDVVIPGR